MELDWPKLLSTIFRQHSKISNNFRRVAHISPLLSHNYLFITTKKGDHIHISSIAIFCPMAIMRMGCNALVPSTQYDIKINEWVFFFSLKSESSILFSSFVFVVFCMNRYNVLKFCFSIQCNVCLFFRPFFIVLHCPNGSLFKFTQFLIVTAFAIGIAIYRRPLYPVAF